MDPSRRLTKSDKAKIRRLELEKWREAKARKNLELKKTKRPPLLPAGRSSIFTADLSGNQKVVKKKTLDSKLKSYNRKTTMPFDTRTESTAYSCYSLGGNSAVSKNRKRRDSTFSLEDEKNPDFNSVSTLKLRKRKSVQFKDRPEEIATSPERIQEVDNHYGSPAMDELTKDDIRRRSYAGRTPFSCASSRSGSTPGRPGLPPPDFKDGSDNSFITPQSLKIKKSRNSQGRQYVFKCSFNNTPTIERDPYLLRIRTPKTTDTPQHNTSVKKTPAKGNIKTRKSNSGSSKKKNLAVSFRDDVIKSPSFSSPVMKIRKNSSDKENLVPKDSNELMDQNRSVNSTSGLSFLDEKYSDSRFLMSSRRSVNK